jgi:hypothetical protein
VLNRGNRPGSAAGRFKFLGDALHVYSSSIRYKANEICHLVLKLLLVPSFQLWNFPLLISRKARINSILSNAQDAELPHPFKPRPYTIPSPSEFHSNAGAFSKYFMTSRTPPRKIAHQFRSDLPALGIQASHFWILPTGFRGLHFIWRPRERGLQLLHMTAQIGPVQVVGPSR